MFISEQIASLQTLRESFSPQQLAVVDGRAAEIARSALQELHAKLPQLTGLKFRESPENLSIKFAYHALESAAPLNPNATLQWGIAQPPERIVSVVTLACFAPEEVLRAMVAHEACHIIYSMIDPESIGPVRVGARASEYPEHLRVEEQWVSDLASSLGSDEGAMVAWVAAVEAAGVNWKEVFGKYREISRTIEEEDLRTDRPLKSVGHESGQEQWREERAISERTLAVLHAKLDALSTQERQALVGRGIDAVTESVKKAMKKLARMPEIKWKNPDDYPRFSFDYHYPAEAFANQDGCSIEWARAYPDTGMITILTVALLAPKDVLRALVVHEAMHIVYAKVESDGFPALPIEPDVQQYLQAQQREEQWVRHMAKRLGYVEPLVEMWEVAIELCPENWRPLYYKAKKDMPGSKQRAQA